jgi:sugar (pentulose or hexulose) kinase
VAEQLGERRAVIAAIGVTGQQHGVALLGPDQKPLRPAITWQDRRVVSAMPGREETYLQAFVRRAGGEKAFQRMSAMPAAGYMGPSLFWLAEHDALPSDATACFVPDAAVSLLTGEPPVTDATDGATSGIFDAVSRDWAWEAIERLGWPPGLFPPVRPAGEPMAPLLARYAAETGMPVGTPVCVAAGDNQASFLGSVRHPDESLLLNVGTGAQISATLDTFRRSPRLETRPFFEGRYLIVGAGLFGGRSYSYLRDFFREVGAAFFGASPDQEIYDAMTALAREVPAGAEGVRCSPLFTGTRRGQAERASFTGLTPENFTPGHLARALLEGMAEGFHAFHEEMYPLIGDRERLVGAGNGIRRNRLFQEILAARFGQALEIGAQPEAAATGAALLAATGVGAFRTVDAASAILRVAERIPPA